MTSAFSHKRQSVLYLYLSINRKTCEVHKIKHEIQVNKKGSYST